MIPRVIRGRGFGRPGAPFGGVVNSIQPRSVDHNLALRRRRLSNALAGILGFNLMDTILTLLPGVTVHVGLQ